MASHNGSTPKHWWDVYTNDKECKLFKCLARGKEWRTTEGLAKGTGLKIADVEAILAKYISQGIVHQHSKEPHKFRYWERATIKKKTADSISSEDKKKRIKERMTTP